MNNMKKLASLLLALVMVLAMAAPAMAAEVEGEAAETPKTYTITINNDASGHTYEAYQIFTGSLGANGELGDIKWGANVSEAGKTAMGDAATKAGSLTEENVKTFADEVAKYLTGTPAVGTEVKTGEGDEQTTEKYTISGLVAGYYLIKDKDGSLDGKDDAYTSYILEVVENSTVNPKSDKPSVVKKVDDKNDSNTTEDEVVWNDSADYDIGDAVPFQLKATLADNVSAYDTYKVVFHDTLSAGLTYNNDAEVYFGETEVTSSFTITEENGTLTISCDNVKAFGAGDKAVITVEYTATLNENAVIGAVGNPNTVKLEYSNNPNWVNEGNDGVDNDGDGKTDEPDEGEDDDEGDEPTGETPEDKVIVFTYKVVVNKVDKDEQPLTGAGFTLYKKNAAGEYIAFGGELTGEEMTQFEWSGLDDGDYKIVETTTPSGYNTIADIFFTIEATHSEIADEPVLLTLVVKDAEGSVISDPDDEEATFNADLAKGEVSTDVVNVAGATLPETGGMGTTVIYVIGCLMVAGAAIVLFAKKRAAK